MEHKKLCGMNLLFRKARTFTRAILAGGVCEDSTSERLETTFSITLNERLELACDSVIMTCPDREVVLANLISIELEPVLLTNILSTAYKKVYLSFIK